MGLELIIGVGAFVILGIMFLMLHESSIYDEIHDPITEEIITRAETNPVPVQTQEKAD